MALFGRETEQDRERAESWSRWAKRQNALAMISLVLGIFSVIEFGALVIPGVAGIAFGAIALRQLRRVGQAVDGQTDRAEITSPAGAGSIAYAPSDSPPPIQASTYESSEPHVPRSQGRALAWIGIVASVLSLICAVVLYRGRLG
ncbi:hypothetical protein BH09PLA1_BH09PLA1_22420 [soil metagenome]